MGKPSRRTLIRLWYSGLVALMLTPFSLLATGSAQTAVTIPDAKPASTGWYIDRDPSYTDPIFGPAAPGDGARAAYAEEHIFVGWDGADQTKPEYLSAINFDLLQLGIPEKSTISSFVVTMIEHETSNPNARTHNTPNTETAVTQGIIACGAPTFISGQPGESYTRAPERDCSAPVTGVRAPTSLDPDATPDKGHTYSWRFDLSATVASLLQDEGSIAFTFEPKPDATQNQSWLLSFHGPDYKEAESAGGPLVPKPGISAAITYTPPVTTDTTGGGQEDFEEFTEFTEGSEAPSFSDSDGLVEELAPEPEAPAADAPSRPLAAGTFREGRVPFWDIPAFAWALILFSVLTLGASGWLLQLAPAAPRPPGAVSALMNGNNLRREQP